MSPETEYIPPKRILQFCVEEFIERDEKEDHTDLKKILRECDTIQRKKTLYLCAG